MFADGTVGAAGLLPAFRALAVGGMLFGGKPTAGFAFSAVGGAFEDKLDGAKLNG